MPVIINKEDVEEKFIRSRGHGGQNVNKVSTCVQIKHIPTGVTVKCDVYRTQAKNREFGLLLLKIKIEKIEKDRLAKEQSEFEKDRRKTRRKPRKLKEEILKDKKIQGEKKQMRRKPEA